MFYLNAQILEVCEPTQIRISPFVSKRKPKEETSSVVLVSNELELKDAVDKAFDSIF